VASGIRRALDAPPGAGLAAFLSWTVLARPANPSVVLGPIGL
jgi:hypothetical protein